MYSQVIMDAVDRIEKLLIETRTPIGRLCRIVGDELQTERTGFISAATIKEAFRSKHGKAMTTFRQEHTGLTNGQIVKEHTVSHREQEFNRVLTLLRTTHFTVGDIAEMAGFRSRSELTTQFRARNVGTATQYRKRHQYIKPYGREKAVRRRLHVNGGMYLNNRRLGRTSTARYPARTHIKPNDVVLSVTCKGLSFSVSRMTHQERVTVDVSMIVKTGFLTGERASLTESNIVTVDLDDGEKLRIQLAYDLVRHDVILTFMTDRLNINQIEATFMLAVTHL